MYHDACPEQLATLDCDLSILLTNQVCWLPQL